MRSDARSTQREEDELSRLVREGVRPQGVSERIDLSLRQLAGDVPRGVAAPSKTLRKAIGGGHELLSLVKFGLIGLFLSSGGVLFLAVGLVGSGSAVLLGLGAVCTGLGGWSLRSACHAFRNFRAISRA